MSARASHSELLNQDVVQIRDAIRSGSYVGQTSGLASGKLQANLVIMPAEHAADFETFCRENPRPCPLVGKTGIGDPDWRALGDIDIRFDVPSYNIYRDGILDDSVEDIADIWRDDWIAFALGCSFSFEAAMRREGVPVWHIEADRTVPMYRTNTETNPAGPFCGAMVVSMRLIPEHQLLVTQETTGRFPWAHGAPVHIGEPGEIGISDIQHPDWGDEPVGNGTPVFWACGVTSQNAITSARLPIVVTHTPGHMLITDIEDTENAFIR